jgi:hypothetical protein
VRVKQPKLRDTMNESPLHHLVQLRDANGPVVRSRHHTSVGIVERDAANFCLVDTLYLRHTLSCEHIEHLRVCLCVCEYMCVWGHMCGYMCVCVCVST